MKTLKSFLICLLITITFTCSKDADPNQQENPQLIDSFLDADIINALNTLEFDFKSGMETPNISGDFIFYPLLLVNNTTNITYENDTTYLNGRIYQISNLNAETRKFNFQIIDLDGNSINPLVSDTFYYGEGNDFCAFIKLLASEQAEEPYTLLAISGVITEEGIVDAEHSQVNLTDIEELGFEHLRGQGQLSKDEDGLAQRD